MDENGFNGPSYLAQRYVDGKSLLLFFKKLYHNIPVSEEEYFYVGEQIAPGFWLRRKLGGSDDEMWDFLKTVLDKYDSYQYGQ